MATITWRNLNAPQLETNFQDNSLKGFADLFSGLAAQNQYAKDKEKADATEALKSSFFNYTGKEGEESLNRLRDSGQLTSMLEGMGDKVDAEAVRNAFTTSQTRLQQDNLRQQTAAERDRLLAQKPYVDAVDLLISQGDLPGAKAYVSGLSQQGVIDNSLGAKMFGALTSAEETGQTKEAKRLAGLTAAEKAKQQLESDNLVKQLGASWQQISSAMPEEEIPILAQEFKRNALANGMPIDVVSRFDEELRKRFSLQKPYDFGEDKAAEAQSQKALNMLSNNLNVLTADNTRVLNKAGLSGTTLGEDAGLEPIVKRLEGLGMSPNSKDGDAQDRYSYVMEVLANPAFATVDSNVAKRIIEKVVADRSGDWVNLDSGYKRDIEKELRSYLATEKYKEDAKKINDGKSAVQEAADALFEAQRSSLQLIPKKGF